MKPILVSSGEPAGIGPDLCLALVNHALPIVVLGDPEVLQARAALLGVQVSIDEYQFDRPFQQRPNHLAVRSIRCPVSVDPGILNPSAAEYVLAMLTVGAQYCLSSQASALVTAPVHKAIINQAGIPFTGHTEFFSELSAAQTVMLLVSAQMRVSLVTTHLPLRDVPAAITQEKLLDHLDILYHSLQTDFGIVSPRLAVAGLNPHAGEGGYLGQEERTVIEPVIHQLQGRGLAIQGPYSADTIFFSSQNCDAFVTMYHDQGLPVLKYASFGHAVNVTCGLPFIRTSVDHGTALELAGTGRASAQSLLAAVELAAEMVSHHG